MEKIIKLGDQEKVFRATGATPIKYRKTFKGGDFFKELINLKQINLENLTTADIEVIERAAFVMCEDSGKAGMTFEKWLDSLDLFDIIQAAPEIVSCITGNLDTQQITRPAKNGDPAES